MYTCYERFYDIAAFVMIMKDLCFMQEERLEVLQRRLEIPFDGASPEHQVLFHVYRMLS